MQLLEPDQFKMRNTRLFEKTRDALRELLPGARIEHVGASAIDGACSKGDLDLCIILPAAQHGNAVELLCVRGWHIKQDTFRSDELTMLQSDNTDDLALQLVAAGSKFLFFITFRNRLNANPALVERYNQIKYRHADAAPDIYRAAKNAFIEQVLAEAEADSASSL